MNRGMICVIAASFIVLCTLMQSTYALPFYGHNRHRDYLVEVEDPDAVLEMLAKLGQSILRAQHEGSNIKRGLDLGLGRGFSGSQAAKHLMGLAAANLAAGPGKKKRVGDGLMVEIPSRPSDFLGFDPQQQLSAPTSNEAIEWNNSGSSTGKD